MKDDENLNSIVNQINSQLDPLNFETKETKENLNIEKNEKEIQAKEFKEQFLEKTLSFNSDVYSNKSEALNTQGTFTSEIFNEEKDLDLDLPLFTSTKYTSFKWKMTHLLLYLVYKLDENEKMLKDYYIRPNGIVFLRGYYFPLVFVDYFNKKNKNVISINIAEQIKYIRKKIISLLNWGIKSAIII